jgi:hypothetical protein
LTKPYHPTKKNSHKIFIIFAPLTAPKKNKRKKPIIYYFCINWNEKKEEGIAREARLPDEILQEVESLARIKQWSVSLVSLCKTACESLSLTSF